MFPASSVTTHRCAEGQATPLGSKFRSGSVLYTGFHFRPGPVGVVVVQIPLSPAKPSVATHRFLDGHAMLRNAPFVLTGITRQDLARVGFVLTTTFTPSSAMQNRTRGQLSAVAWRRTSTLAPFQATAPPVGFVEVNSWPPSLTATHSRGDAHEIGPGGEPGFTGSAVIAQALAPPSGCLEISTPPACVPTHRWTDGHARSVIPSGTANGSRWSINAGADQVIDDAAHGPAKHPSASAAPMSASPLRTTPT